MDDPGKKIRRLEEYIRELEGENKKLKKVIAKLAPKARQQMIVDALNDAMKGDYE